MARILQPTSVIKAKLGIEPGGKVHKEFTKICFKKMTKFVPGGTTSTLNKTVAIKTDKIVYKHPGAHYLWKGILYVDPITKKGAFYSPDYGYWSRKGVAKIPTNRKLIYHTPGTGSYWDKRMWSIEKNEVIKEVQDYMEKLK